MSSEAATSKGSLQERSVKKPTIDGKALIELIKKKFTFVFETLRNGNLTATDQEIRESLILARKRGRLQYEQAMAVVLAEQGRTDVMVSNSKLGAAEDYLYTQKLPAIAFAVIYGHASSVETLLCEGADANYAEPESDMSMLSLAARENRPKIVRLLLAHHAEVNRTDKLGHTPLTYACIQGHFEVIAILLRCKATVNHANTAGNTGLMLAAISGHTEVVDLLLKYGASCDQVNSNGYTALISACISGEVAVVERLLQEAINIDYAEPSSGRTALMFAAMAGQTAIIRLLLEKGADANRPDRFGEVALKFAIEKNHLGAVKELLKAADIKIDHPNENSFTPLLGASLKGNPEIVQALLDHKANPNLGEKTDITPIMFATNLSVMRILLEANADPNHLSQHREFPLLTALLRDHIDIIKLLLAEKKIDPNLTDEVGNNLLMVAIARKRHLAANIFLNDERTNIHHRNNSGGTALMFAARHGDLVMLNALIKKGSDVNAADKKGNTALLLAVTSTDLKNQIQIIERLLATENIDVDRANYEGCTATLIALKNEHRNVVRMLVDAAEKKNPKEIAPDTKEEWQEDVEEEKLAQKTKDKKKNKKKKKKKKKRVQPEEEKTPTTTLETTSPPTPSHVEEVNTVVTEETPPDSPPEISVLDRESSKIRALEITSSPVSFPPEEKMLETTSPPSSSMSIYEEYEEYDFSETSLDGHLPSNLNFLDEPNQDEEKPTFFYQRNRDEENEEDEEVVAYDEESMESRTPFRAILSENFPYQMQRVLGKNKLVWLLVLWDVFLEMYPHACLFGGAIRDICLGREPTDFDFIGCGNVFRSTKQLNAEAEAYQLTQRETTALISREIEMGTAIANKLFLKMRKHYPDGKYYRFRIEPIFNGPIPGLLSGEFSVENEVRISIPFQITGVPNFTLFREENTTHDYFDVSCNTLAAERLRLQLFPLCREAAFEHVYRGILDSVWGGEIGADRWERWASVDWTRITRLLRFLFSTKLQMMMTTELQFALNNALCTLNLFLTKCKMTSSAFEHSIERLPEQISFKDYMKLLKYVNDNGSTELACWFSKIAEKKWSAALNQQWQETKATAAYSADFFSESRRVHQRSNNAEPVMPSQEILEKGNNAYVSKFRSC